MLKNTLGQPELALYVMLAGLVFGAVFFFWEKMRRRLSAKKDTRLLRGVVDFVYAIAAGGVFFLINYFVADGRINVMVMGLYLLAILLGFRVLKLLSAAIFSFRAKR